MVKMKHSAFRPKISVHAVIFSVLVLSMCVLIFIFSSQDINESSVTSGRIVSLVTKLTIPEMEQLSPEVRQQTLMDITRIIRKGAHFSEYAILAQLTFQLLLAIPRPRKDITCAVCAFVFTVLFAVTDEYHQSFVPGRAMMATDVLIDAAGAVLGIIVAIAVTEFLKKRYHRQKACQ